MQLSITVLLASLVAVLISHDAFVDAAPVVERNPGMVSLPIKRLQARSDAHPQVMFQQRVNRAHRRLARMSGTKEPSDEELESNLVKRILSIRDAEIEKRYNRGGIGRHSKRFDRNGFYSFKDLEGVDGLDSIITGSSTNAANTPYPSVGSTPGASNPNADNLTPANSPTAQNSLGLDIEGVDVGYVATIQIGTPPRSFSILMDSGSADFWVGSEDCQNSDRGGEGCGNHRFLGNSTSSTFESSRQTFDVTYGTGAVSGNLARDNVVVAGLKLTGHIFGTASQESDDFANDDVSFDGLMGLAQSILSEQRTLTPVEALAKNGLIKSAITSYKISRLQDEKNDGEITFGGLDQSKFDPKSLTTVANVNQQGFWEAEMPAVTVDGKNLGLQGRTAILDTGTTLIVAPAADAAKLHSLIPGAEPDGQGGFIIPCDTTTQVALKFGNNLFTIDPRDLALQPSSQGNCNSGITSGNVGGPDQWLVGDVFLKNAYYSTDVTNNQISLAKLV